MEQQQIIQQNETSNNINTNQNNINSGQTNQAQQQCKGLDLEKLSKSSLRKYVAFFGLNADCTNDSDMNAKVQNHFNKELNVEPTFVLDKLLKLKKEERDDGIKRPTTRKKQRVMHFDLE